MIKVINFTTNEVVGTFDSIAEISKEFGIDRSSVSKVLKGKRKSCNGFTFVNDSDNSVPTSEVPTVPTSEVPTVPTSEVPTVPTSDAVPTTLRALRPSEVMRKLENSLRYNKSLTVDELVDAVEDCYHWIWQGVDKNNTDSVRKGYLLISELGRIVFNTFNYHKLKWRDSSRRWLKEDIAKLHLAEKELLGDKEGNGYFLGVEAALNQIVTTDNPIVRCFWLSLFYEYNKAKDADRAEIKMI